MTMVNSGLKGLTQLCVNPYPAQVIALNNHPLEVGSRYSEPKWGGGGNYSHLCNLRPNICKSEFIWKMNSDLQMFGLKLYKSANIAYYSLAQQFNG